MRVKPFRDDTRYSVPFAVADGQNSTRAPGHLVPRTVLSSSRGSRGGRRLHGCVVVKQRFLTTCLRLQAGGSEAESGFLFDCFKRGGSASAGSRNGGRESAGALL